MASFIYARTSTDRQECNNQLAKLREKYPQAEIHEETASGVKSRPVLQALVARAQKGDVIIVAELSRLGRRMSETVRLIEDLHERGVAVCSDREQINYSSASGRMLTQVLASVAEMERAYLIERTRAALAAKRSQGIIGGRRPTYSPETVAKARELRSQGMTCRAIAAQLGMSASRVSEVCRAPKAA